MSVHYHVVLEITYCCEAPDVEEDAFVECIAGQVEDMLERASQQDGSLRFERPPNAQQDPPGIGVKIVVENDDQEQDQHDAQLH